VQWLPSKDKSSTKDLYVPSWYVHERSHWVEGQANGTLSFPDVAHCIDLDVFLLTLVQTLNQTNSPLRALEPRIPQSLVGALLFPCFAIYPMDSAGRGLSLGTECPVER
jgi:hypothetical protein